MYNCPSCQELIVINSFQDVRHHLNDHKTFGALILPIVCRQVETCKSSFNSVSTFMRHFRRFHSDDLQLDALAWEDFGNEVNIQEDNMEEADMEEPGDVNDFQIEAQENYDANRNTIKGLMDNLKNEIFSMVVDFRSKGSVPHSTTLEVVDVITSVIDTIIDYVKQEVEECFTSIENIDEIPQKIQQFTNDIVKAKSTSRLFNSEYKIRMQYESHPLFVLPESIVMNTNLENHIGKDGKCVVQRKYNCAQYVPITKSLKTFCSVPENAALLFDSPPSPKVDGNYSNFTDGERYKNSPINYDNSRKYVVHFQIYEDGVGIVNPFSANASMHSSAMFYWKCLDILDEKSVSTLANMHLIAVCNNMDLKQEDGLDIILEYIVEEILMFESQGVEIDVPGKGKIRVYGTLSQFTGDNLAVNQIFGLVEGFSGDYCCAICYATRTEMQQHTREIKFKIRNKEDYEIDCRELEDSDALHVRGVKKRCKLNNLRFFHVMENYINDCMHTVSQGVIPHIMSCIVHTLWKDGDITVEVFNRELRFIVSQLQVERKNKPCEINCFLPAGKGFSPKYSAAQMCTLFRYLPIMLSSYIENGKKCWKLFLMMQEIVDLVFANRFTENMLQNFELLYSEFLVKYKKIYPNIPIKPKMHFLVHLPNVIRKNGPPKHFWTMGYERLNGAMKKPSHIMNNFVNPQKTLAYRQQCSSLANLLKKKLTSSSLFVSKSNFVDMEDFIESQWYDTARPFLSITATGIEFSEKISVNGVEYQEGFFVVLDSNETGGFVFGKIVAIIRETPEIPILLMELFETDWFEQHSFTHSIKEMLPPQKKASKISDLLDYHPLDGISRSSEIHIRMKYSVMKENQFF